VIDEPTSHLAAERNTPADVDPHEVVRRFESDCPRVDLTRVPRTEQALRFAGYPAHSPLIDDLMAERDARRHARDERRKPPSRSSPACRVIHHAAARPWAGKATARGRRRFRSPSRRAAPRNVRKTASTGLRSTAFFTARRECPSSPSRPSSPHSSLRGNSADNYRGHRCATPLRTRARRGSACAPCPLEDPLRACREEPRGASGRIGGCPRNRGQGSQGYCVRLVCVPANEGVLTSATSTTTASTGEQRELRVCAGMRRSKGRVQIPPSPPRKVLIRGNCLPLLPRNLPFLPCFRCGWR